MLFFVPHKTQRDAVAGQFTRPRRFHPCLFHTAGKRGDIVAKRRFIGSGGAILGGQGFRVQLATGLGAAGAGDLFYQPRVGLVLNEIGGDVFLLNLID